MSVVGYSIAQGLTAREVAMKAAQEALDQIGTNQPAFGIVIISREFNLADVSMGLTSLLGDIPMWGFTTITPLTDKGEQHRSILVALFGGSSLKAYVNWMPEIETHSEDATSKLLASIIRQRTRFTSVLASMDASIADQSILEKILKETGVTVSGCLPAGDYARETTFQVAKNQFGSGSISLAMLGGKFKMGTGFAHGWEKTGLIFNAKSFRGHWLEEIDGQMPVDFYSRKFGCQPGQWLSPPQSELLRLYPLGIDNPEDDMGVRIVSPLRFEESGKLRLTGMVSPQSVLHLMVGSRNACVDSITRAAQQARRQLFGQTASRSTQTKVQPLLGMVFIDLAWRYLFETQPNVYIQAVKQALGDVPVIGTYSLGQLATVISPVTETSHEGNFTRVLNQGIAVCLIGEELG